MSRITIFSIKGKNYKHPKQYNSMDRSGYCSFDGTAIPCSHQNLHRTENDKNIIVLKYDFEAKEYTKNYGRIGM